MPRMRAETGGFPSNRCGRMVIAKGHARPGLTLMTNEQDEASS